MTLTGAATDRTADAIPPLVGVHHLGLTVRNIDESENWYVQVLGMARVFVEQHPTGGGHTVVMTQPGTALFFGLDHHPEVDLERFDPRRTGLDHLALRLESRDDLDAWVARFDALGVEHGDVHENAEPEMAAITVNDPDGIPIELCWSAA